MRSLPESIGPIHFVGIGGIGMSGIAEVLHNLGYRVQGSDLADSANTRRLAGLGIAVMIGHRAENLDAAEVIVVSSAVKPDNPEVVAARARRLPVVRRAEMLAELMRLKWSIAIAGTHGKTTTTSMLGALLETAGLDPTVINGGIINAYGTNTRLGAGDWMAVEADESDGTFTRLPATVAIVTNIDPEHLDFYGDFAQLQQAFETFVGNIPFYGFAVLCIDHPVVQGIIARLTERRILTYGLSPQADIRATNIRLAPDGSHYDAVIADRVSGEERVLAGLFLPMFGEHNVQNSLTVLAVAEEMGLGDEVVRASLRNFKGVRRRFTKTGEWNGIAIIDDYGHHPVEIAAVLKAARAIALLDEKEGRVIAIVQPHRYTRLANLFDGFCTCFNDADMVLVADVYAAGEEPIADALRDALVAGLTAHGHRNARALSGPDEIAPLLRELARPDDIVVCLGAGSITNWANGLPDELAKLDARSRVARARVQSSRAEIPPSPPSGERVGVRGRSAIGVGTLTHRPLARAVPPSPAVQERVSTPTYCRGRTMISGRSLGDRLPPVRGRLVADAPIGPLTWFRIGGPAELLFRPADEDDLADFLAATPRDIPVTVIGVGSNLLVRDGGIPGVTIRLGRGFSDVETGADEVSAGAGALDGNVALAAAEAGIAGLEFLSGIPGTIGGGFRTNAGAYGSEFKDVLISAAAVDRAGQVHRVGAAELGLSYRHSAAPPDWIFTSAMFRGTPGDRATIARRLAQIQAAREASQPIRARTGGSTFANPPGRQAWQLIDEAGCRGLAHGGAVVSEKHTNFLINTGNAIAADIEGLGEEVRRRVHDRFGILLEWEIRRIGMPATGSVPAEMPHGAR